MRTRKHCCERSAPKRPSRLNQKTYAVGGLEGQAVANFLSSEDLKRLKPLANSFEFKGFTDGPIEPRFAWKQRPQWLSRNVSWPPAGRHVTFHFEPPQAEAHTAGESVLTGIDLQVHFELYDGLPLICKWFTLTNHSANSVRLNSFISEQLACVEASSQVEDLAEPRLPNLHVETDFTTCSMEGSTAQVDSVHWSADPKYATQVNYNVSRFVCWNVDRRWVPRSISQWAKPFRASALG